MPSLPRARARETRNDVMFSYDTQLRNFCELRVNKIPTCLIKINTESRARSLGRPVTKLSTLRLSIKSQTQTVLDNYF